MPHIYDLADAFGEPGADAGQRLRCESYGQVRVGI
jgi:hypothetical protein